MASTKKSTTPTALAEAAQSTTKGASSTIKGVSAAARKKLLERLWLAEAEALLAALDNGDCTAATLNVVRQFLSDQGTNASSLNSKEDMAEAIRRDFPFPSPTSSSSSPAAEHAAQPEAAPRPQPASSFPFPSS